jgi:hypothetical protein
MARYARRLHGMAGAVWEPGSRQCGRSLGFRIACAGAGDRDPTVICGGRRDTAGPAFYVVSAIKSFASDARQQTTDLDTAHRLPPNYFIGAATAEVIPHIE